MYNLSKLAAGSVIVATAALGSAGVASADGYERKGKVVYERPSDWSGVYFGLSSGYQWSSVSVENPAFPPDFSVNHDSYLIGAHLGAQHQWGNIVLGVEGGWSTAFRNNFASTDCPPPNNVAFTCSARFNDVLTIGPRLGWAAGHWMPYVTGGYANARFAEKITIKAAPANPFEDSQRHSGWYVGGGVEWVISPGWTMGLEYRHYEFNDASYIPSRNIAGGAQDPLIGAANIGDPSLDTITARVSWKFGREVARPLK